jgi:membrane associated rhomboid family serine protease
MVWQKEHNGEFEEEWLAIPSEPDKGEGSGLLSERRAHLWALVLESRSFPCRIEPLGIYRRLLVPAERFAAACSELSLFERENRNWPPLPPPASPLTENTLATLSLLILLATFHNLTQLDISLFGHGPVDWIALGNAHSARILEGQWWRLVTALTLHADWLHLVSNLALGGIFIVSLCRELGSGLAWCLLLSSGVLGNLANAFLQHPDHRSVGASTVVFGAVGILAALNLLRNRRYLQRRWPLPVAAALALLALLGTEGKQTDLGAHLFGFIFGLGIGLAGGYLVERRGRPGTLLNALLALACAVAVAASWWAALVFGRQL